MSKKKVIYLIITALIVGLFIILGQNSTANQFNYDRLTLSYPGDYQEQTKPEAKPNQTEVLLVLRINNDKLYRSVVLAKEKNATKGANVSRMNFLDFLENNANATLPTVYPRYERSKIERNKIDGHDSSLITFSYIGTDDKTPVYAKRLILPLDNDAYHLIFVSLNQKQLEKDASFVLKSLKID